MADVAFDPNKQESPNTTTDILSNQSPNDAQNKQQSPGTSGSGYVSNGNPYGSYGTPQNNSNQSTQNTVKKTTSKAPSSGQHTNVQSYIDQNQAGSKRLGETVANKLQTSADLARQNLQGTQKSFNQGMEAGSLENWQGANAEAKGAYTQAATQNAPERQFNENQATMYTPGTSEQDKALIASNQARAVFGDNTTKDFNTQAEAQTAIDGWNKQNPGHYTYGNQPQLSTSDDRLSDILNAKYTGPTDLHQVSGYSDSYNQFGKAQSLQDLAQAPGFKGTLLKETFQNPNTSYSLGNQTLDDLLLGQGKAADTLKNTANNLGVGPSGKMSDEFTSKVNESRNLALGRAKDINDVRTQARSDLDMIASGRSDEIEGRLANVMKDWDKYPDHYKKVLQEELDKHNAAKGATGQFGTINTNLKSIQDQLAKAPIGGGKSLADSFSSGGPRQVFDDYNKLNSEKAQLLSQAQNNESYFGPYGEMAAKANPQGYQKAVAAKSRLAEIDKDLQGLQQLIPQSPDANIFGNPDGMSNSSLDTKLRDYQNNQNQQYKQYQDLSGQQSAYQKQIEDMNKQYGVDFNKFDPNSMNIGLSALESEMLGIKGGEGLYNLLSQPGGVDNLIKTSKADKNQLVSQNEQSQLSRLQSIAQLADDYGSEGSGIDFRNQYNNRDLAGNQTALDALDMNNLRDKLQGSEKEFRDFADAKTVTGVGTGKGSSGGLLGKKTKKVTDYQTANLGDVLDKAGANRNMYSDEGVNQKNVNDILGLSKTMAGNDGSYASGTNSGAPDVSRMGADYVGSNSLLGKGASLTGMMTGDPGSTIQGVGDLTGDAANIYKNIVGNTPLLSQHAGLLGGLANTMSTVGSNISSSMFGNAGSAAKKASSNAQAASLADLQNNILNTLNTSGYGNQFVKQNNTQRDTDLLKLLGLLDTTNR